MNDVYEKIYDIVENNILDQGGDFTYTKAAFLFEANRECNELDFLKLLKLNNQEFFEAAYLGMLGRLPDDGAYKSWDHHIKNMASQAFQERLTKSILSSNEFKLKGIVIKNCIYALNSVDNNIHGSVNSKIAIYSILHKVYKKLPLKIRLIIRRILGKD